MFHNLIICDILSLQQRIRRFFMTLSIAICDDDLNSLDIIQTELYKSAKDLSISVEIFLYTNGYKIIDLICNNKEIFDILFLDIDMPDISGLETAKKLRETHPELILIFISAHEQYVFESIDYNPFKYIRKSKMHDEIRIALKRAYTRILNELPKFTIVKTEEGELHIHHADILYFEMFLRKLTLYTKDGKERKLIGRKSIKNLYEELNDLDFVQIHSGCIVNTKYIMEYSNHDITLTNGKKLIVSRSKIKAVKEAIARYWGKKL